MRRFGLIGYPLGHSFSKKYFADKFKRENIIDAEYENYPLPDINRFPEIVAGINGLAGLNVTIPHKTNVIRYLTETDKDSATVGAVNVIKIREIGGVKKLKGFNTDIYGFRESLLPYLRPHHTRALILGTGGSSLAVRFVLCSLGIDYLNVSRTSSAVNIAYSDLTDEIINERNIIINTTPLGMYPEVEFCPGINYDALSEKHILYDLIYNPELTKFLSKGEERGCTIIGGMSMLYLQAEKSWEIWNDPDE